MTDGEPWEHPAAGPGGYPLLGEPVREEDGREWHPSEGAAGEALSIVLPGSAAEECALYADALLAARSGHLPELTDVFELPGAERDGAEVGVAVRAVQGPSAAELFACRPARAGECVTVLVAVLRALGALRVAGFTVREPRLQAVRVQSAGVPVLVALSGLCRLPGDGEPMRAAAGEGHAGIGRFAASCAVACGGDPERWRAELLAALSEAEPEHALEAAEAAAFRLADPEPIRLPLPSGERAPLRRARRRRSGGAEHGAAQQPLSRDSQGRPARSRPGLAAAARSGVDTLAGDHRLSRLAAAARPRRALLAGLAAGVPLAVVVLVLLPGAEHPGSSAAGPGASAAPGAEDGGLSGSSAGAVEPSPAAGPGRSPGVTPSASPAAPRPPAPGAGEPRGQPPAQGQSAQGQGRAQGQLPQAQPPEGGSQVRPGGLDGDDPVAAAHALVEATAVCARGSAPECWTLVLRPDALVDGQRLGALLREHGLLDASGAVPKSAPQLVSRNGDAAVVTFAGSAGPQTPPASLLIVRGEAGWGIRALY